MSASLDDHVPISIPVWSRLSARGKTSFSQSQGVQSMCSRDREPRACSSFSSVNPDESSTRSVFGCKVAGRVSQWVGRVFKRPKTEGGIVFGEHRGVEVDDLVHSKHAAIQFTPLFRPVVQHLEQHQKLLFPRLKQSRKDGHRP
jgi:hypothetical protein